MNRRMVIATGNEHKMEEVRMILKDLAFEIVSMKEIGIEMDIEESGNSFMENAIIKARAVAQRCGEIVLADDSGLEIDYLNKEPGIYSARYMGEDTSYHIKNHAIISRLAGVVDEKRTARFVCAMAAVFPNEDTVTAWGFIEGRVGYEEAGENGFGYDPIFYLPEYGCSMAQLTPEEKNTISHRARALEQMKMELSGRIKNESIDCK